MVYLFLTRTDLNENAILYETPLSRQLTVFFIVYCLMDLLIGCAYFEYQEEMSILTGWCHHVFYAIVLVYILTEEISMAFGIFLPMEAPTIVLSLGHLKKQWRREKTFGISFFFLRLVYHIYLLNQFLRFKAYPYLWICVLLALFLHIHWWASWARSFFGFKKKKEKIDLKTLNGLLDQKQD
eukprot:TRINITY_DN3406_c0_g1_i2.p1 TRINITY_DN3406_c0_g1~~TRINITY_DN3406_c0_g1_i2.p1  ORF type:complete len:182 (-),score=14.90 TRINITY_DN3406_c0_g1_i2:249-794(-)